MPRNPHRRPRRRSRPGRIILAVAALLALALLIGGIGRIGHQSGPYDASLNRSFATQAAVLAAESTQTGSSVRHVLATAPGLTRLTLQADLDGVTTQADDQAARAATLASGGGPQGEFAQVFADRAQAVTDLRTALDGLLGMAPLPVAGAPALVTRVAGSTTVPSATEASSRITGVGSLLLRADQEYGTVRRSVAAGPGHARLPGSRWVSDPASWQLAAVTADVNQIAAALPVTHDLVLSVVQVTPPAVPSPTGAATPSVSNLSPTTKITLTVVLTNDGTVEEPHAAVTFSLVPQPAGATATATATTATTTATASRRTALAASRSATLAPVSFTVKPGDSYQLTVAVGLPAGVAATPQTSLTEVLQIAPSS